MALVVKVGGRKIRRVHKLQLRALTRLYNSRKYPFYLEPEWSHAMNFAMVIIKLPANANLTTASDFSILLEGLE